MATDPFFALPRLFQTRPFPISGAWFLPLAGESAGHAPALEAVAAAHPAVALVQPTGSLSIAGVNIDGQRVELGAEGPPMARFELGPEGELAPLLEALAALAPFAEPALLVAREGAAALVIELGPSGPALRRSPSWVDALVEAGGAELAEEALSAPADRWTKPEDGPAEAVLAPLELAERALPDSYGPPYRRGWVLNELGRYDEALAALHLALERASDDRERAAVHASLGYACHELRRWPDAVAHYREAHRLGPHRARRDLGVALLHGGEPDRAEPWLKPRGPGRRLAEAATAFHRAGRVDDARALLRVALVCEPTLTRPVPENQWPKPFDLAWARGPAYRDIDLEPWAKPAPPADDDDGD